MADGTQTYLEQGDLERERERERCSSKHMERISLINYLVL